MKNKYGVNTNGTGDNRQTGTRKITKAQTRL
jgi:hypothetical protein